MPETTRSANGGRILLITAAFVIVVAGMREAQGVLVPFLLSGFIAIIAAPALFFLRAYRVPSVIAIILVILVIAAIGLLLGVLVGSAVDDFSSQLPTYQAKLKTLTGEGLQWLSGMGVPLPEQIFSKLLDPTRAMSMAAQGLSSLGGLLTNTFLILLTVVFILLEASSFPGKLQRILANPEQSFPHFDQFIDNIKRYMVIKTGTSLLTGVFIYLWLLAVGVDYPVLWGVIAFFLNFVPNIGSIIAAIPALLLALVQLGAGGTAWTALGYLLANNLVGNVIEPRFMGKGLGLSSLVVFRSLVFWGWSLGTVGMFLSVPLTMTIKIALDSNDDTRWLAILLGPAIEDEADHIKPGGLLRWRLPSKQESDE